jgi:hypothetical protein
LEGREEGKKGMGMGMKLDGGSLLINACASSSSLYALYICTEGRRWTEEK